MTNKISRLKDASHPKQLISFLCFYVLYWFFHMVLSLQDNVKTKKCIFFRVTPLGSKLGQHCLWTQTTCRNSISKHCSRYSNSTAIVCSAMTCNITLHTDRTVWYNCVVEYSLYSLQWLFYIPQHASLKVLSDSISCKLSGSKTEY